MLHLKYFCGKSDPKPLSFHRMGYSGRATKITFSQKYFHYVYEHRYALIQNTDLNGWGN